jgi:hypothetical protein
MADMKNLTNVYLTYAMHTYHADIITPYEPWGIGEVSAELCHDEKYDQRWSYRLTSSNYQRMPTTPVWDDASAQFFDYEYRMIAVKARIKGGADTGLDKTCPLPQWGYNPSWRSGRGCT